MKDKMGIVVGIGIAAAVLVTLFFYVANAGNIELTEIWGSLNSSSFSCICAMG